MKPRSGPCRLLLISVAPRTGAWIETLIWFSSFRQAEVAPRTGAWIETQRFLEAFVGSRVAPRTGAWIETLINLLNTGGSNVAPRTGAWIETPPALALNRLARSPPARGRGLKLNY